MSNEKESSEPNVEPSSRQWALSRKLGGKLWWINIMLVFFCTLIQLYIWSFLFIGTRPTPTAIGALVGTFAVAVYFTFMAASAARRHDSNNWLVVVTVGYAFLLIIGEFATLYWTFGTKGNFNVELSQVDAIYFALGTLTTAGTGNITPTSQLAKIFVMVQMVLGLVFVAGAVTIAFTKWSEKSS